MTEVSSRETILSRQLRQLAEAGIREVVMTTGLFDSVLVNYCQSLELPLHISFIKNPVYQETNYIYSIYCARAWLGDDDIILLHGDLVFETQILDAMIAYPHSCIAGSKEAELPQKDFKAVFQGDYLAKVGVDLFDNAVAVQPFYKLKQKDWSVWLKQICRFCEAGNVNCYAEDALYEISANMHIKLYDTGR